MISLAIFMLSLAILGTVFGSFKVKNYSDEDDRPNFRQIFKSVGVLVIAIIIGFLQPIEIQRIDAGNVGLKVDRIGNDKGVPVARPCKGWVFYNRWTTDVIEYSIRQFHVQYNEFQVAAKGGTLIPVKPGFNLLLKPESAVDVYIHLLKGADLESLSTTWLSTATNIALKNATNLFTPDSIFNHANIYQQQVEAELNKQLSKYFKVEQINPGQAPPASMKEILQAKANSVQAAQQAELNRITAVATAQSKIATARGDSAALVIDAMAQAEAIRQKTRELSATYVDYIKWSAWNGVLPTTSLGAGTNVLLNK